MGPLELSAGSNVNLRVESVLVQKQSMEQATTFHKQNGISESHMNQHLPKPSGNMSYADQ